MQSSKCECCIQLMPEHRTDFHTQNDALGERWYFPMCSLQWDKSSMRWKNMKLIWNMKIILYRNFLISIDVRSHIATIWWRRRKSRIPKVCRVLTFNPYWHCGPIAEYNWQCAEEMNTLYMITYTSIDGNPLFCWPWLVTSKRKHSKEYSYRITCRRIWTFCNAD